MTGGTIPRAMFNARIDHDMNLLQEFEQLIDAITVAQIPYAVCGGIAVTIHGFPRTTRDIDLLIRTEDLPHILGCVRPLGYNLEGGMLPVGHGEPYERNIFRVSKAAGKDLLTLDLALVNPLLEEAWQTRQAYEWNGRTVQVVSRAGLSQMKRLSGRPQDLVDLDRLGITDE